MSPLLWIALGFLVVMVLAAGLAASPPRGKRRRHK